MNARMIWLVIVALFGGLILTPGVTVVESQTGAHHTHHESTPEPHHHDMDHMDHAEHMDMDMSNMSTGAFYFVVQNHGDEADRLVMVETDAAEIVEIHNVIMDDGVMKMEPQPDGVEIPAHGHLSLETGGYHIMMIGLHESLLDGESFTATLHFEHAGAVEITVPIHMLEPKDDEFADPVTEGDIEIERVWARQAPKLDGMATPMATPEN